MEEGFASYTCAYCGEGNETFVDPTAGTHQSFVEDCAVCCHPNVLNVDVDPSNGRVNIEAEFEG
jgi:hypothetical protein